jgi:formylglycine-generating enzyme required for sulfatase activity
MTAGESLLLVVDQFEELFRYRRRMMGVDGGAEADLLVRLLLTSVRRPDAPVYVVLTMRSDFLGDCSQFAGLPEALSESQYLIPRLTRDQRRQAIEEPLRLFGAGATSQLVEQLLNDSGTETDDVTDDSGYRGRAPDPLPVLQHALMRTYAHWLSLPRDQAGDRMDLRHYQAAGRMESALDQHAEAMYRDTLDDAGRRWAERIFRCLTTTELGRPIRRPTPLDELYAVIGAQDHERAGVDKAIDLFRGPEQSFLHVSGEKTVDISHESLIWRWKRLGAWVRQETASAEMYRDLAKNSQGDTTWGEPKLSSTLALRDKEAWNAAWARQYSEADFSLANAFLDRSRTAVRNQRWLRWSAAAAVLAVVVLAVWMFRQAEEVASLKAARDTLSNDLTAATTKQVALADQIARLDARAARNGATQAERDQIAREKADLQDQLKQSQDDSGRLSKDLQQATTLQGTVAALQGRLDKAQSDLAEESNKRQAAETKTSELEGRLIAATKPPAGVSRARDLGLLPNEPLLGFVLIPGGPFTMGSEKSETSFSEEGPLHSVSLQDFYIGRYEVSVMEFKACVDDGECQPFDARTVAGDGRWPVRYVSWHEARAYCGWLEKKLKAWPGVPGELRALLSGERGVAWHVTLPSEAEWEKAARGTDRREYPWGEGIDLSRANYFDAERRTPTPVGFFPAGKSPYGLMDMAGNVSEWTRSLYRPYPYQPEDGRENLGAPDSEKRALRGGTFNYYATHLRTARRGAWEPVNRNDDIGFRVVFSRVRP